MRGNPRRPSLGVSVKKHLVLAPLLCVAFTVGGCGAGDETPLAGDTTSPSASPVSSGPAAPESSAPAVPPATGTRLALPSAAVRVPDDDWVAEAADTGAGGAYLLDGSGGLTLLDKPPGSL